MTVRVRVEEMISAGIVLVHASLHEPHPEHAGIKIEILLRGSSDRRDVMKSVDGVHREHHRAAGERALLQMIRFDERDTGRAIHAADDGSVIAGSEVSENRRFQIAARGEPGADESGLLRIFPVIIR